MSNPGATMPQSHHTEKHFKAGEIVRDIVIGMFDGLTVPFALAARLSGAVASTSIVVTAGLAEVAAGAIAMGLGGYLAARGDAEHYANERRREEEEIVTMPEQEQAEVADVFRAYGLVEQEITPIVAALKSKPDAWIDFMMRFELGLEKPEPTRARNSALMIAVSYVLGGIVPLLPYMLVPVAHEALLISVVVTLLALTVFGYVKGNFAGTTPIRSAAQTAVIGGLAAGAAYLIAKLIVRS